MSAGRPIRIECSKTVKNILCEALLNFAYFSQDIQDHPDRSLIRSDILAITHEIEQQFEKTGIIQNLDESAIEYCQRAIDYHYDRIFYLLNANVDEQRKLMSELLSGKPIGDEQLDTALLKDSVI